MQRKDNKPLDYKGKKDGHGQVAQLVGALSHIIKRLRVQSPDKEGIGGRQLIFLSHIKVPPSLCLTLSLSQINKDILRWVLLIKGKMLKAIHIYLKSITRRKVKKISKLLKEKAIEKENRIGINEKIRISIKERVLEVTVTRKK